MISRDEIKKSLGSVLPETHYTNLGKRVQGKVRDVYVQDDKLLLIATDRYSAFDRNLALVPFKGTLLTQVSSFWFEETKDIVQNHILDLPDPNVVVGKKCKVVPIEVVVRGYITGVTGTALWTLYEKGERKFGDTTLPEGMKKNEKLAKPILTPTTKSDEHDRPVTAREIVEEGIVEKKLWEEIEEKAFALFARGQELAAKRGLILVDTKYEFGVDESGVLTLIDEIHTPDSSRYWQMGTYEERLRQGLEPENFDKEFLRLWFKEHSNPYEDRELPKAPEDMIVTLSERYITIYEQITGRTFMPDLTLPIEERIIKNLQEYLL